MSKARSGLGPRAASPETIGGYDQLRQQALGGDERGEGLALLTCRGAVAWMKAWVQWTPHAARVPPPETSPSASVSSGLRGEVTRILVAMALGPKRQEITP